MDRFSCCSCGVTVWRRVLAFLLAGGLSMGAAAGGLSRAQQLLEQGDLKQAQVLVDEHLASRPDSVQGRFLRGVILARRNESAQAIAVFSQLTKDEPQLLEAYNNLAVLYARQQDYDKARSALEAATKADPTFAAISGNLRTTYGWLASRAYDKALGQNAVPAPGNLVLLGKLREPEPPKPAPAVPAREAVPAPARAEVFARTDAPAKPAAAAPARETAPAPAKSEVVAKADAPAKPAAPAKGSEADVRRALDDWVAAWERKDMKAYLAAYAPDFAPAGGMKRKAWEEERSKRIVKKKGKIQLTIERVQISVKQDVATVQFRQHYKVEGYSDTTQKLMTFSKRGSRWRITMERSDG
ncbi:MAG: hypothetical protein RJA36_1139 [Pseudomonadota bacterium]|jgi:ketosteroid isomerase-like protein